MLPPEKPVRRKTLDFSNRDDQNDVRFGEWTPTSPSVEPFVQVPRSFFQGLSPEEWRAMQQVYETAYRRAVEQQRRRSNDQFFDPLLEMGDGI